MNPILKGAITGFVIAAGVDLHAYAQGTGPFDFKKAIARWIAGAITGATGNAL